jgi:transcriptional regulator with XRE-family HTH domain
MLPVLRTPPELALLLAQRVRELRLSRGWTRVELAERSGVAAETLKLFERSGKISLHRLLLLAQSLGALGGFEQLLLTPPARSLDEIERRAEKRKRGRRQ